MVTTPPRSGRYPLQDQGLAGGLERTSPPALGLVVSRRHRGPPPLGVASPTGTPGRISEVLTSCGISGGVTLLLVVLGFGLELTTSEGTLQGSSLTLHVVFASLAPLVFAYGPGGALKALTKRMRPTWRSGPQGPEVVESIHDPREKGRLFLALVSHFMGPLAWGGG